MARRTMEPPATLMGLMMSSDDLTLPPIATPPRPRERPASTSHSEADTYASAASTIVDQPVVIHVTSPNDRTRQARPCTPDNTARDESNQQSDEKEGFVQVVRPEHMSGGESPPSPQRGRLGHIVSITGIKRSLSQTDLRLPRRGTRIKSAMSKLSKNWQQHFGNQGATVEDGAKEKM